MSTYSIKDLENLTGIRTHTIRIWEQRFGLLKPHRTPGNIRYYDDEQLRKLLNVSLLLEEGMKISEIAGLEEGEVKDRLKMYEEVPTKDNTRLYLISQLISAGLAYDEFLFEKAFSSSLLRFGLLDSYLKVLYPMLVKVGKMWSRKDMIPTQEHFISNLVKQKFFTAIDSIPSPVKPKATWVLFLPEEEEHEIGLLLSTLILKKHGVRVIYLGQRVPYYNLKEVIEQNKPDCLHFFIVRHQPIELIQELLKDIDKDFTELRVWISGSSIFKKQISLPDQCRWINSVEEFLEIV